MTRRQITNYAVFIIAALVAALINGLITKYVHQHIDQNGYTLVLIDMLAVILIFAPIFAIVSKYTKKLSTVYLRTSKRVSGNKKSILLGFTAALILLFILYAVYRHNLNVLQDLKNLIP